MGGGGWSWVEVEMSRVEVDGAGWRWVHGSLELVKFPSEMKPADVTPVF